MSTEQKRICFIKSNKRSGTADWALIKTEHGESADFIHKMNIALKKQMKQVAHALLHGNDYTESKVFESVVEDCRKKQASDSIIKTSKKKTIDGQWTIGQLCIVGPSTVN